LKETSESTKKNIASTLPEDCDTSSKNELTAQKCERDVDSMKFAEFMSKHLNEQFEVTVSNVSRFGCFVQMENSIEGLIKTQNLGNNEYFTYNEKTMELNGKKGTRISLGTKLLAECILADKEQRKIEFKLIKLIRNR
jgi:ribonuclease R